MKADDKWPQFMRGEAEPTLAAPTNEADQDELHLDLDSLTVDDLTPPAGRRRSPQSLSRRDNRAKKSRRVLPVVLGILALAVLGMGGAFGYFWFFGGKSDRTAPMVQALDDPVKVKPASPGGLEVPYQDQLVLNKPDGETSGQPTVEHLLPPPETPKPPVREPEAAVTGQSTVAPPKDAATATDSLETFVAPAPPVSAVVDAPVPTKSPVVEVPAAKATSPAAAVQTAATGTYLLQLGSFASAAGAEGAWAKLQKSFPDLLGDMSLFLQEAFVNEKTYHRVRAGPFPNRATALDLCAQLKAEKQDCLVVRR